MEANTLGMFNCSCSAIGINGLLTLMGLLLLLLLAYGTIVTGDASIVAADGDG